MVNLLKCSDWCKGWLTAAFVFVMALAHAQEVPVGPASLRLGVQLSPAFTNIHGKGISNSSNSLVLNIGALADFNFTSRFALSSGLNVLTFNGNTTELDVNPYDYATPDSRDVYNLHYHTVYLELPLAVKLRTQKIGSLAWYGRTGLSNGFLLSAKQDARTLKNALIAEGENIKGRTIGYRAGFLLGGGAEYDLGKRITAIGGLGVNLGLTNIIAQGGRKGRNSSFEITVGLLF